MEIWEAIDGDMLHAAGDLDGSVVDVLRICKLGRGVDTTPIFCGL